MWLGVLGALLFAASAASARTGPLSFGAPARIDHATVDAQEWAPNSLSGQLMVVNATGCLEVFSTPYPQTSWRIAWLHSLFANAASVSATPDRCRPRWIPPWRPRGADGWSARQRR